MSEVADMLDENGNTSKNVRDEDATDENVANEDSTDGNVTDEDSRDENVTDEDGTDVTDVTDWYATEENATYYRAQPRNAM